MLSSLKQIALCACVIGAAGAGAADAARDVAQGAAHSTAAGSATGSLNMQARIVGGAALDISYAPSTVALLNNDRLSQSGSYFQSQFCGGTVIGARWVLTAAHCLFSSDGRITGANELSVLMGSTDLETAVNEPVGVTRVITHAGYNPDTNADDIALLQLEYDALVPATPLDTQASALNDVALIAGWGALNEGSEAQDQYFSTSLQGALVRMIPGELCNGMFEAYAGQLDESNLCAGVVEGGIDSCQGDSGGPMYRYDVNDPAALRLAGVTSWGFGCANAATPGVYTRVAAFVDWIGINTGGTQPLPPLVLDDAPVTTLDVPPVVQTGTATTNGIVSQSSNGGGASGFFMLSLLGPAMWFRRYVQRTSAALPVAPHHRFGNRT